MKKRSKKIDSIANKKKLEKELDKLWSLKVKARDKYCLKCGSRGVLEAHHIYGRRNLGTRWDVRNGISLCHPCHFYWAHRDIGKCYSFWVNLVGEKTAEEVMCLANSVFKPTYQNLLSIKEQLI